MTPIKEIMAHRSGIPKEVAAGNAPKRSLRQLQQAQTSFHSHHVTLTQQKEVLSNSRVGMEVMLWLIIAP